MSIANGIANNTQLTREADGTQMKSVDQSIDRSTPKLSGEVVNGERIDTVDLSSQARSDVDKASPVASSDLEPAGRRMDDAPSTSAASPAGNQAEDAAEQGRLDAVFVKIPGIDASTPDLDVIV